MKKSNYFLAVLAVLFSFTACNNIPEPPIPSPEDQPTLIFLETFGNPAQIGTQWPTIAQFTELEGFVTTGIGADSVTFSSSGGRVDVRGNFNSNYLGASGEGNVMFSTGSGGTLYVNNIATCGARNLVLSFGASEICDIISVAYRINGTIEWVEIPFEKLLSGWSLVDNLNITLPEGTNTINLRFTATASDRGARIDDIRITTTDETGAPIIDPDDIPVIEPIFLETFGDVAETTIVANYTGWDNQYPIVFSGNTDVRRTSTLNSHVWFASTTVTNPTRFLTISGINTENATNLILSFDLAVGNADATAIPINELMTVSVTDLDTGTETTLNIPTITITPHNVFRNVADISGIPATSNLEITFRSTTSNIGGVRLDNVRIDGER